MNAQVDIVNQDQQEHVYLTALYRVNSWIAANVDKASLNL